MNKKLFVCALVSVLVPVANAADGTVNFAGTILTSACTVDAASATQTVNLGTINAASFTNVGDTASNETIKIKMGACPVSITKIGTRFDGVRAAGNSNLLGLTAGGASGVGIGIYESNSSTLIPLGTTSAKIDAPATGSSIELVYVAKYVSTVVGTSIIGGIANATSTFTLEYN